jgi:hypothetical protein
MVVRRRRLTHRRAAITRKLGLILLKRSRGTLLSKRYDRLIEQCGPGLSLAMVARRVKCTVCGKRGAHIQPCPPPDKSQHGYLDWMREERLRAAAFLAETAALIPPAKGDP